MAYKLCEGWLEHKKYGQHGQPSYRRIWVVLKGNILYIFNNEQTTAENQVGCLTIDAHSKFYIRRADHAKGFKFELLTGRRMNRFKARKSADREVWRGYFLGVSKEKVPDDLDLPDTVIQTIEHDIGRYLSGQGGKRQSIRSERSKESDRDSGLVSIGPEDAISGISKPRSVSTYSPSSVSTHSPSSGSKTLFDGGPTMRHNFGPGHAEQPSWFFQKCSRESAQRILEAGCRFGNTLLRESTSHIQNGSYVISKRIWDELSRSYTFEHYEVMRTARGYKLNVQNPHEEMKTLTEVINYFLETAPDTKMMQTNDLETLGLRTPDYQTTIQHYDQSRSEVMRSCTNPRVDGTSTVTPSILKNPTNSSNAPKQVEFHKRQSSMHPSHTYSGPSSRRQSAPPSVIDMPTRNQETEQLDLLERTIASFDQDHIYMNDGSGEDANVFRLEEDNTLESGELQERGYTNEQIGAAFSAVRRQTGHDIVSMDQVLTYLLENEGKQSSAAAAATHATTPPPPAPHKLLDSQCYYNEHDPDTMDFPPPPPNIPFADDESYQNLGVAPPPPSVPFKGTNAPPPDSGPHTLPKPKHKPLHQSVSSPGLTNVQPKLAQPVSPTAQINTSVTQVSHRRLSQAGSPSVASPASLPTWNQRQSGSASNPNETRNSAAQSSAGPTVPEVQSGIDDKTPGKVGDIRSIFEKASPENRSDGPAMKRGSSVDDMQGEFRKVQFPSHDSAGDTLPRHVSGFQGDGTTAGRQRRQTEPALSISESETRGLTETFREQLKQTLFKTQQGRVSQNLTPFSPSAGEEMYDEIQQIVPDEVTYVNDKYNQ